MAGREDFLTMGSGKIGLPDMEANEIVWEDSIMIAVTTNGTILYLDEDGNNCVDTVTGCRVVITEVEYSAFSMLADLAAEKSTANVCETCNDSDAVVARRVPPVCPACYRGSSKHARWRGKVQ